jgi:hypothetical protein
VKVPEPIDPNCVEGYQKLVFTILHEMIADMGKGDPIANWALARRGTGSFRPTAPPPVS